MKKFHLFSLVAILLTVFSMKGETFPMQLDGTMMPYHFSMDSSEVPWSDELQPIFINYVARHGARFLSSKKKIEEISNELTLAKDKGKLSEKGEEFLRLIATVDSVTDGRWGALNTTGIEEEQKLGKEITASCPKLLKEGDIMAISSYVPRVVMTMYELCHQLAEYSSFLNITTGEGRKYNPLLRYFTTDSTYVAYLDHGDWKTEYDRFSSATLPTAPAASMLPAERDARKLQKLSLAAYGVLQSLNAAGIEADPEIWFSLQDYRKCWEISNLKHYYQRSANRFSDIAAKSAAPLLEDMIDKADSAFSAIDSTPKAYLRFGHAETVIPLFALMHLPGCYAPDCVAEEVSTNWKDWEVSPLGANLMMVCLRDKDGYDYVALRLNGKWVENNNTKIFKWEELKQLWQGYISQS